MSWHVLKPLHCWLYLGKVQLYFFMYITRRVIGFPVVGHDWQKHVTAILTL